ncbi:hypothetical protein ACFLRF_01315 [Candidatus Altiarchaeota archaeon]
MIKASAARCGPCDVRWLYDRREDAVPELLPVDTEDLDLSKLAPYFDLPDEEEDDGEYRVRRKQASGDSQAKKTGAGRGLIGRAKGFVSRVLSRVKGFVKGKLGL